MINNNNNFHMFFSKNSYRMIIGTLVCAVLFFYSSLTLAVDIIKVNHDQSLTDSRTLYKIDVLNKVMQATKEKYGPYEIIMQGPATTNSRAILEVKSGKTINTFLAITTQEWEKNTLPIRIPVRRGILSCRLLATTEDKLPLFEDIKSLEDLKELKVGIKAEWVTTEILKKAGFNVFEANSYEGLFYMLSSGRIDYLVRGVNEIYPELNQRKDTLPNLRVEPNLALHIPAPYYFFVSPHNKKLAQRITEGLEIIIKNKVLDEIFEKYYGDSFMRANLKARRLLRVGNTTLSQKTPFERKKLWLEFDSDFK